MNKIQLKGNSHLYPLYLLKCALSKDSFMDMLHIRRHPHTIQLPITSRCNSRCVTCNVWKQKDNIDIDAVALKSILKDPYFSKVKSVGINGGEITVCPTFQEILDAVLTLKSLRSIYIITNGLLPNKLLPLLEETKCKCDAHGIILNVTLSVDGVGKIHEETRGIPNCWSRTKMLLDAFRDNKNRYASRVMIGCTLSQKNIPYVIETEEFLSHYPFEVNYHLAVPNKRIHTFNDAKDYYVVDDAYTLMLATEYFYHKFRTARWTNKYAYFAQYYFLKNKGKGRLTRCQYKFRDITIDENLRFYLCATASNMIGEAKVSDMSSIINKKNFNRVERQMLKECDSCVHYIGDRPTIKGVVLFVKELVVNLFNWKKKFKIIS